MDLVALLTLADHASESMDPNRTSAVDMTLEVVDAAVDSLEKRFKQRGHLLLDKARLFRDCSTGSTVE